MGGLGQLIGGHLTDKNEGNKAYLADKLAKYACQWPRQHHLTCGDVLHRERHDWAVRVCPINKRPQGKPGCGALGGFGLLEEPAVCTALYKHLTYFHLSKAMANLRRGIMPSRPADRRLIVEQ